MSSAEAGCPTDATLERRLGGRATDAERVELDAHLRACPACASRAAEMQADDALLGEVRSAWTEALVDAGGAREPGDPSTLGRYRILRRIGAGGMGVVYEAEQKNPRRRVALKVLSTALGSASAQRRFEHEVHVLARLDHPAIARILEADALGTLEDARPFFVMELVLGRDLRTYLVLKQPGLHEKLELFLQIADGVQHAHQNGVMHRDLKPSNVLVTAGGRAKILDFGVARTLDRDTTDARTEDGRVVGTLSYMSPEQVRGQTARVDTRSDVYALGLLLYEMLTGELPYAFEGRTLPEVAHVVTTVEPLRLHDRLPGASDDLDWILRRALRKERDERYPTVAGFAEDVRRYLAHEPVSARPPSALDAARKYARRNPAAFLASLAALVALVLGGAFAGWAALRARHAEQRAFGAERVALASERQARLATEDARASERAARAEAEAATAVSRFLVELLGSDDPDGVSDPSITTVAQVLERAEARLAMEAEAPGGLAPRVEAAVRIALGNAHRAGGRLERAEANLERALDLRRTHLGTQHPETAGALNTLAVLRYEQGLRDEATALLRQALDTYLALPDVPWERVATSKANLATMLYVGGNYAEAEPLLEDALALHTEHLGAASGAVASDHVHLATLHGYLGHDTEVERHLLAAIAAYDQAGLDPPSPRAVDARERLGTWLARWERPDESIALFEEALRLRRILEPDGGPGLAGALRGLADVLAALDLAGEACDLLEESLGMDDRADVRRRIRSLRGTGAANRGE